MIMVMFFCFYVPTSSESDINIIIVNHNRKKMVEHFLTIMIMSITSDLMIMFLHVPTKT